MRDLEALVERLEQGDLPLEESLAAFERGVMLTRSCQTALKEAELKVEILLKKTGGQTIEEFDAAAGTAVGAGAAAAAGTGVDSDGGGGT